MAGQFGKYLIEAEIGAGAFGIVYRAVDTTLGRPIALKLMHPVLMTDGHWVERFRGEAQAMARLNHPHIVTVYEIGEQQSRLFIAMEYVAGPNLGERLKEGGALSWPEALQTARDIASALDHAHAAGVLHRDLKPENVLLGANGAMLTDFGVARLVGESRMGSTLSGGIVGTPNYIAPEVWRDQGSGAPADIYALGCIVYEMLTGKRLYEGSSTPAVMHAHFQPPVLPDEWPPDVPPGLNEVLEKTVSQEPLERYGSSAVFVMELTKLGESRKLAVNGLQLQPSHSHLPNAKVVDKQRTVTAWVWGVSALLALFLVLLLIPAIRGLGEVLNRGSENGRVKTEAVQTGVPQTVGDVTAGRNTEHTTTATRVPPSSTPAPTNSPAETRWPSRTPRPTAIAVAPTPKLELGASRIRPADNMTMLYVPPGGFLMGSADSDLNAISDELPQHAVILDAFWIDRTEVTIVQYIRCAAAGECPRGGLSNSSDQDYPISTLVTS